MTGLSYVFLRRLGLLLTAIFAFLVAFPALANQTKNFATDQFTFSSPPITSNAHSFLSPQKAFSFSWSTTSNNQIKLHWNIAKGYHLYRNQMHFRLLNTPGFKLETTQLPSAKIIHDPILGKLAVYPHPITITITLRKIRSSADAGTLWVHYQGCADKGICYPPIIQKIHFNFTPTADHSQTSSKTSVQPVSTAAIQGNTLVHFILKKPLWMSLGLFFLIGIGLAFTPCIFPMIPILTGLIIGQKTTPSTKRAFILSLTYVLAMAITYSLIGVLAGVSGARIQPLFESPWVLTAFALIFVILALSMFGLYDIQAPTALQSHLTKLSNQQKGGTLWGVAIMGILSALIVGPCVTAPLVAILLVIANTGSAVFGGLILFFLSLGMGLPLLIIGTLGAKFLPKAGYWMTTIKHIFGVILLGVAIWFISRFVSTSITILLSGILLIGAGIYMHAIDPLPTNTNGWQRLAKVIGVLIFLWGILLIIGLAQGNHNFLTPLKNQSQTLPPPTQESSRNKPLQFHAIESLSELNHWVDQAKKQHKPLLLDIWAQWCVSCKELDLRTFSNPQVQKKLSQFILVRADVTSLSTNQNKLLHHYQLFGPPDLLFFNSNGQLIPQLTVTGFIAANPLLKLLSQIH